MPQPLFIAANLRESSYLLKITHNRAFSSTQFLDHQNDIVRLIDYLDKRGTVIATVYGLFK